MRILWLKTELLHPVDKGGKIRTYQMLRQLRRDHHITYLTLDDGSADPDARERALEEYCHELVCVPHRTNRKFSAAFYVELARNVFSSQPYFMAKYRSSEMRRKIEEFTARGKFDVVVCDFLVPGINMPEQVGCATVLFQHNVEAMIWRRHYEVQPAPLKKLYLREQWRKARAIEAAACRRFDSVIAVSSEDAAMMRREYGVKNVGDVPTGVDTEFFRPQRTGEAKGNKLVFTGSMDWLPNEDAIEYFVTRILPRVKERVPGVTLTVVGRNPYPKLIELSRRDASIEVTGRVPDVRPYMDDAAVYIVPIRIGGGTRLKIYEAMAMELPVVSTTIGAEGLPVQTGSDLLLADAPEAFADRVVELLADRAFAARLGAQAAETVRTKFGWETVARRFAELCEEARGARPARDAAEEGHDTGKHLTVCLAAKDKQ